MGRVNESSTSHVNAEVKVKAIAAGIVKGEGETISSALIIIQAVYLETF